MCTTRIHTHTVTRPTLKIYRNDFPQHMVFNLASVNEKRWITLLRCESGVATKTKVCRCSRAKHKMKKMREKKTTTTTKQCLKSEERTIDKVSVRLFRTIVLSQLNFPVYLLYGDLFFIILIYLQAGSVSFVVPYRRRGRVRTCELLCRRSNVAATGCNRWVSTRITNFEECFTHVRHTILQK